MDDGMSDSKTFQLTLRQNWNRAVSNCRKWL